MVSRLAAPRATAFFMAHAPTAWSRWSSGRLPRQVFALLVRVDLMGKFFQCRKATPSCLFSHVGHNRLFCGHFWPRSAKPQAPSGPCVAHHRATPCRRRPMSSTVPTPLALRGNEPPRKSAPQRPPGFTLVELLSTVAIIGVLMSLFLAAVQASRESARRSSCAHRLHNQALALTEFQTAHQYFPPGRTISRTQE